MSLEPGDSLGLISLEPCHLKQGSSDIIWLIFVLVSTSAPACASPTGSAKAKCWQLRCNPRSVIARSRRCCLKHQGPDSLSPFAKTRTRSGAQFIQEYKCTPVTLNTKPSGHLGTTAKHGEPLLAVVRGREPPPLAFPTMAEPTTLACHTRYTRACSRHSRGEASPALMQK